MELPSQSDQLAFAAHRDYKAEEEKTTLSPALETDYFLQVIYFSHIVGLTIRELYEPTQIDLSADQMLYSTSSLDSTWLSGSPAFRGIYGLTWDIPLRSPSPSSARCVSLFPFSFGDLCLGFTKTKIHPA